jgi:hypothetical protein
MSSPDIKNFPELLNTVESYYEIITAIQPVIAIPNV